MAFASWDATIRHPLAPSNISTSLRCQASCALSAEECKVKSTRFNQNARFSPQRLWRRWELSARTHVLSFRPNMRPQRTRSIYKKLTHENNCLRSSRVQRGLRAGSLFAFSKMINRGLLITRETAPHELHSRRAFLLIM